MNCYLRPGPANLPNVEPMKKRKLVHLVTTSNSDNNYSGQTPAEVVSPERLQTQACRTHIHAAVLKAFSTLGMNCWGDANSDKTQYAVLQSHTTANMATLTPAYGDCGSADMLTWWCTIICSIPWPFGDGGTCHLEAFPLLMHAAHETFMWPGDGFSTEWIMPAHVQVLL